MHRRTCESQSQSQPSIYSPTFHFFFLSSLDAAAAAAAYVLLLLLLFQNWLIEIWGWCQVAFHYKISNSSAHRPVKWQSDLATIMPPSISHFYSKYVSWISGSPCWSIRSLNPKSGMGGNVPPPTDLRRKLFPGAETEASGEHVYVWIPEMFSSLKTPGKPIPPSRSSAQISSVMKMSLVW